MNMQGKFKSTAPVQVSRSWRIDNARGVSTGKAGNFLPLRYIPLLREDRLSNCQVGVTVEMAETVRPLLNAVYVNVMAAFIPFAAFPRFQGIDDFNRSYAGIAGADPFIRSVAYEENDLYRSLGIHGVPGESHNAAVIEAYNVFINHLYDVRSPNLPERTEMDTTKATCFWHQNKFAQIVPNYDRSLLDGIVPVQSVGDLHTKGIGLGQTQASTTRTPTMSGGEGNTTIQGWQAVETATNAAGEAHVIIEEDPNSPGYPYIRTTFEGAAVHFSLMNLDLAKKKAAFDALRKRYEGHDDDEIIELLMQGIRVPEYMERQPMILANKTTQMGFSTRFASDGASLEQSVTNGVASVMLNLNMPRTNTGGIVLILASVVPDQMFERKRDPFLAITDQNNWPVYERDTIDVEKVDQVLNCDVDTSHTTPSSVFGHEPLNYKWNREFVRLGGELYRPSATSPWDEDRAVLWVTEPVDPKLTADFYLATAVNADPFADQASDHLTITTVHSGRVEGNTVFGTPLLEIPAEAAVV